MTYIYDIMLNLNEDLIEFFEWEDSDSISYIKRIPMYKISSFMIDDIITKQIKISKGFLNDIKGKTLLNNQDDLEYLVLFSDTKIVLGVLFDESGKIVALSRLMVDEEEEILDFTNRLKEETIDYEIIGIKNNSDNYYTRNEKMIIKTLEKEITELYQNNRVDKLNYFYYEYFNKISNNKEKVYKELLESINNNFNEKHLMLYEVMKLSYFNK